MCMDPLPKRQAGVIGKADGQRPQILLSPWVEHALPETPD